MNFKEQRSLLRSWFEQVPFSYWTSTFFISSKYIFHIEQVHFSYNMIKEQQRIPISSNFFTTLLKLNTIISQQLWSCVKSVPCEPSWGSKLCCDWKSAFNTGVKVFHNVVHIAGIVMVDRCGLMSSWWHA